MGRSSQGRTATDSEQLCGCLTYSFHLEEKLGFVLTQDEIAWLALLIHQASMETGSEKQGIFVMATDPYSAKYEAMKIENEISNLEIIKIVHIHDLNQN